MSDRELLTECLEALTHDAAQRTFAGGVRMSQLAIKLRAHLAAPRPEPVAWMYVNSEGECEQIEYGTEAIDDDSITLLYAAPPAAAPDELKAEIDRYEELRQMWAQRVAENERLRGLLTDASKAVWMNYDGKLLDRIEAALKEVPR